MSRLFRVKAVSQQEPLLASEGDVSRNHEPKQRWPKARVKRGGRGERGKNKRTRRQRVGEHLVNLGARHVCILVVGISRHAASIAPVGLVL